VELAQMASRPRPDGSTPVVVLGGPDPTQDPASYLGHAFVDLVVHHEGEQTFTALADALDRGAPLPLETPGLAYLSQGEMVVNRPADPIEDLDSLPLPARDLIDMNKYLETWDDLSGYSSMTIATSRGCPFGCEWCQTAVHGNGFRQRSPENVAAEMKVLKQTWQIDRLRMVDDVEGIEASWFDEWARVATETDAVIGFEALNDLSRSDIPLLDVADSL